MRFNGFSLIDNVKNNPTTLWSDCACERCPKLEDLNSIFICILCLGFYLRGWIGKKRPIIQLRAASRRDFYRIARCVVQTRPKIADGYSRSGRFNVHSNVIDRDSAAIVNNAPKNRNFIHNFHTGKKNFLSFALKLPLIFSIRNS